MSARQHYVQLLKPWIHYENFARHIVYCDASYYISDDCTFLLFIQEETYEWYFILYFICLHKRIFAYCVLRWIISIWWLYFSVIHSVESIRTDKEWYHIVLYLLTYTNISVLCTAMYHIYLLGVLFCYICSNTGKVSFHIVL